MTRSFDEPGRRVANGDESFAGARARMVETQLRARGIRDPLVLNAMGTVPREAFVPDALRDLAYADEALPIEHGQTISQPFMVGVMTELLEVRPGDRVLDVGTGSGYQAAVLAAMGCRVTSIERLPELAATARARLVALGFADRVEVRVGDGSAAEPGGSSWSRIVVAAAAPDVPAALLARLGEGGRLVIPVGGRWEQDLVLVERAGGQVRRTSHGACVFVPLVGEGGFR